MRQLATSETTAAAWRRLLGAILFLAVVAGLVIAVQLIPEWQVKRASVRSSAPNPEAKTTPAEVASLQNEMRKTLIQVVGGAFAIIALYFTYRRVRVSEQGHITDRYTKAIEQLGTMTADNKQNIEVRLGAIYALERIAFDSPRDHWTIMEVLTAYVRQSALAPAKTATEEENKVAMAKGPPTEVQAIMTVLGRRRRSRKREKEGQNLDLSRSDLRNVALNQAHLEGVNFREAHLERADFRGAHLEGANFGEAQLERADFTQAHLKEADFKGAQLEGAKFREAHLEGAKFGEGAEFGAAQLEGADLIGAQLEGADFRRAQLKGAYFINAQLKGAEFSFAQLEGAKFLGAHMEEADFGVAHLKEADFKGAQLEGAKFSGAHMEGTDFRGSHLKEADFKGAHMEGAKFSGAHMEGTEFREAQLEGAEFSFAHMEGADFRGAHLKGTEFREALGLNGAQIIRAEDWQNAHFDEAFARELHAASKASQPNRSPTQPAEKGDPQETET
jgi:uncharacterized protein YjbI with pentapeptide repeats